MSAKYFMAVHPVGVEIFQSEVASRPTFPSKSSAFSFDCIIDLSYYLPYLYFWPHHIVYRKHVNTYFNNALNALIVLYNKNKLHIPSASHKREHKRSMGTHTVINCYTRHKGKCNIND